MGELKTIHIEHLFILHLQSLVISALHCLPKYVNAVPFVLFLNQLTILCNNHDT